MLASRETGRTALLCRPRAAGFALTLYVFCLGIMTFHSLYIYIAFSLEARGAPGDLGRGDAFINRGWNKLSPGISIGPKTLACS
jgi:hypothetical protein